MIVAADDDPTSRLALPLAGLLGAVVGRYRLVSRIGRGGMSEVYLAEHTDPAIDRRVAVKVLRGEYCAQPSLVERSAGSRPLPPPGRRRGLRCRAHR